MKRYRAWAEVDLGGVNRNIQKVKALAGGKVKILVVVKANAYGHGAVAIAKTAFESGTDMVGVGDSSEAIELREAGILGPILILGAIIEEEIGWVVSYSIIPTLHSPAKVESVDAEARRQGKVVEVHMKIDTGMGRLGISPRNALMLARKISGAANLRLAGVFTHFASATAGDVEFTAHQLDVFNRTVAEIEAAGIKIPLRHAANSSGLCMIDASRLDMVRPGAAVLGIDPGNLRTLGFEFEPVLSLKSQIAFIKTVPAGTPVSYGRLFTTQRKSAIATVPIGYNDGYSTLLSNNSRALVRGKFAPVVGRITMDYTMLDLTEVEGARVGDEVVLIGRQESREVRVEELAALMGVPPYEVLCSLGERVKRVYI